MRLSNAWQKVKFAGAIAFGAAMLLYCGGELYAAWTSGTVQPMARYMDRVTFQSSPGWFVGSVLGYAVLGTTLVAFSALAIHNDRNGWRWRTRQDLDAAIRQSPEER